MDNVESMCKIIGCNPDHFESVYTLDVSYLCFAFNKKTDDMVIQTMQQSLDELIAKGRLKELNQKYGNE